MNRDEFDRMLEANAIVFVGDAAWRVAQLVAAAEREACAKVCERLPAQQDIDVRDQCAEAIRARGGE